MNTGLADCIRLTDRQGGAARVSIFFALWSLSLLLLHDVRVAAAPVYDVPARSTEWLTAPKPPVLNPERMWDSLAQRSDVMSGRWNRTPARPRSSARRYSHPTAI